MVLHAGCTAAPARCPDFLTDVHKRGSSGVRIPR